MRVAVADLGTNSTRLLVADVADGRVDEVERLLEITRLGQGVDASGTLEPVAIDRVLACLDRYAERAEARHAERRVAVATSAVRDARNRDELLDAVSARGFAPRVLSGYEEAAATFAGVTSDMSAGGELAVIDVGGGSTEVVLARNGDVLWSQSYPAGCVRTAERYIGSDVVQAERSPAAGPSSPGCSESSSRPVRPAAGPASPSPAPRRQPPRSISASTGTTPSASTDIASAAP